MPQEPYVNVPETISKQAQGFLRTLKDPALMPPFPDATDLVGWKRLQEMMETEGRARSEPFLKRYEHTVIERKLGCSGVGCSP